MFYSPIKIVLIIILLLVNVVFIWSPGTSDVPVWTSFINGIRQSNVDYLFRCITYNCSEAPITYPTLYFLILYIFAKAPMLSSISPFLVVKILIFSFYLLSLVCALIFFWYVGKENKQLHNIDVVLLFLTQLSLFLNTQGLGYVDILMIPPFILSILWMLKNNFFLGGVFYAISLLVKWQPLILLPMILLYVVKIRRLRGIATFFLGIILGIAPLYVIFPDVVGVLLYSLRHALTDQFIAAAPNLPWVAIAALRWLGLSSIFGFGNQMYIVMTQTKDIGLLLLYMVFKIVFLGYYAWIMLKFYKRTEYMDNRENFFFALIGIMVGYYILASGVHENHLIIGGVLAFLLYLLHPSTKNRWLFFQVDSVSALGMFIFYGISGVPLLPLTIRGTSVVTIVAIVFVIWFATKVLPINKDEYKTNI